MLYNMNLPSIVQNEASVAAATAAAAAAMVVVVVVGRRFNDRFLQSKFR